MFHMTAHSLSRFAHGLRPVAISSTTQPSDHMSMLPCRPLLVPVITARHAQLAQRQIEVD